MSKTFVTSYIDPDLDGYACIIAYSEFLSHKNFDACPLIFGIPQAEVDYLTEDGYEECSFFDKTFELGDGKFVLVDASDTGGIHPAVLADRVIEVIDHRSVNDVFNFVNAEINIQLVGAAATLVFEKFKKESLPISVRSKTLLLNAIYLNTLAFNSSVTTERDRTAFQELKKDAYPKNYPSIEMWEYKTKIVINAADYFEKYISFFRVRNEYICIIQLEIVDAKSFIHSQRQRMINASKYYKKATKAQSVLIMLVDVKNSITLFFSVYDSTQTIIKEHFGVEFRECYSVLEKLILRKELAKVITSQEPLIRQK